MEQVINMIAERAGISPDQARKALEAVQGFVKENPQKLTMLLGDDGKLGLDDITKLGGLFR